MRKYRFFVSPECVNPDEGLIEVDQSTRLYIEGILRGAQSVELVAFDGTGTEYVVEWLPDKRRLRIVDRINACINKGFTMSVFQGIPKGTFMEDVVSFCGQVGVDHVYPLITARTVVKLVGASKLDRWRRLAQEACKVGGFCSITQVHDVMTLQDALTLLSTYELVLFLYENAEKPLRQLIESIEQAKSIAIVIGPEGGFEQPEVLLLREVGIETSLGPIIYRSRWAAATAAVIVNYIKGLAG